MVEHERDEHERVAVAKAEATVVEYEVEAILDRRVRRAKLEYLVLWRGYPASQATWESECDLEGCGADHEEVEVEVQCIYMGTGSTTLATTTARTAVALAFVVDVHAVFAAVAASLLRTTTSSFRAPALAVVAAAS